MIYCEVVLLTIAIGGPFAMAHAVILSLLLFMALWSHVKTMTTDPGAIPSDAQPFQHEVEAGATVTMCGRCNCYKPPG